jgi:succinate dehydrogenase / fumarate reductase cytochrome b subunit
VTQAAPSPRSFRTFWLRRLFSFVGVAPLGAYVVWHLYNNAFALRGPAAFDRRLAEVTGSPFYQPLVWLLVYLPFLFHALFGLKVTSTSSPNVRMMPTLRNWKYTLQRASAIGVLLFVPAHVYKTKVSPWLTGTEMSFAHMHEGMLEPITLAVYVLGMLGVCFHLADGLWLAGITWGLFVGRRGQALGEWLSIFFGLVLLAVAYVIIHALWKG